MKLVLLGLLPKLSVAGNVSSFWIRFAAQGELGASPPDGNAGLGERVLI
jgi:hypothetical protein